MLAQQHAIMIVHECVSSVAFFFRLLLFQNMSWWLVVSNPESRESHSKIPTSSSIFAHPALFSPIDVHIRCSPDFPKRQSNQAQSRAARLRNAVALSANIGISAVSVCKHLHFPTSNIGTAVLDVKCSVFEN